MNKFLLSLFIIISGAVSFAADCVSQKEMQDVAKHFTQFNKYANSEFCYDGSQISNLIHTIMFMRKTEFAADMQKSSDEMFSGRFAKSWYNYFIGRIRTIQVQPSCAKGVGAFVYGAGTSTMYVCPMMLTEIFTSLDRASVFMHEARHIDGFPHTTCSSGPRKNLGGACDDKISDAGSYAVTVETYSQLAKYATDLHPALKAYSLASAVTYADEAFETPVRVNRDVQLLVMTNNKNLYALDVNKGLKIQSLGQTPALGKIVPRAQHLILFPEDKTLPAKYMFTRNEGDIPQAAGDAVLEYNAQTPQEKANLVGLHIGAQWIAKIYTNSIKFTCDPNSAAISEIAIPNAQAVSILYIDGYSRSSRTNYLLTSTGDVLEFGCTDRSFKAFVKASTVKVSSQLKRFYKVDNQVIALTNDGSLVLMNGNQMTPIQTGLDGQIYEIAPRQIFSFLDASI